MPILSKNYLDFLPALFVKISRKTTVIVAIFITITSLPSFIKTTETFGEKTNKYFANEIQTVKSRLLTFQKLCTKKAPLPDLRSQFITCRMAYKKMAVLSEYFNIYETKFLNGPALNRAEDGTPDIIIPPKGFQAIEEILYGDQEPGYHKAILNLLTEMQDVLHQMEIERDRMFKFRTETVWDAVRSASIRMVTLGITGFDSPVALQTLTETHAGIEGMKAVLDILKTDSAIKKPELITGLKLLLTHAQAYLKRNNNFNRFDRLTFITTFFNPFYKQLIIARSENGIAVPEGQHPVHFNTTSIFSKDFFNISFFSPGREYWITEKRIELGKKLFFDPILSGTKDRNCATCHTPEKAFGDGLAVPYALDNKTKLTRNSPTLWNSALQTRQFYDTRSDILENQLKEVVHNTDEMRGSLKESANELKNIPAYELLFKEAYADERDPVNPFNIANAISSYIRTLISLQTRFHEYMLGDKSKLFPAEKRGFNLFTGKAKCATCHFIPLFNGLVPPEFTETETEVLGVPSSPSKKKATLDSDPGRFAISNSVIHKFAFKTSTLINIELTAPYMHNGVFNTLEEVMDFYNEGGGAGWKIAPENQTLPTDKLNLTKTEIADIISFMKALTDPAAKNYK